MALAVRRALVIGALLPVALLACSSLKEAIAPGGEDEDEPAEPSGEEDAEVAARDGAKDSGKITKDGGPGQPPPDGGPTPCTVDTCARETMLDALYGPVTIASSGQDLYFVEVGLNVPNGGGWASLLRVPTDKSCTTRACFAVIDGLLIAGELEGQVVHGTTVALGPNHVCVAQTFNSSPSHSIACTNLGNGLRSKPSGGPGDLVGLWIGASEARWAVDRVSVAGTRGEVRGGLLTGSSGTPLATKRAGLSSVTSDGAVTYFTERGAGTADGLVAAIDADGGVVPLATGRSAPMAAAVYGGYVYWAEATAAAIVRAKADGTGSVEPIATTDAIPFALAVDATGVYWACAGSGAPQVHGSVAHAPLTPNGPVDLMMKDLPLVVDLAVDATHVYVATIGASIDAGAIYRVPKTH
jgi:hypothetical protein